MKAWNVIWKILAALAAVAGIVYIIAAYGDKIVSFARRLLGRDFECFCDCDCDNCDCEDCNFDIDELDELDDEEIAEEDADETPVAAEDDFEG